MRNDMDDAVPWYQGIEMFVGMRRLGKEAYLINYNNDVHNPREPREPEGHRDAHAAVLRHHLKGTPAPDWMVKGIPFLRRAATSSRPRIAGEGEAAKKLAGN